MSCLEPHVCGVCGLWVHKSRKRTEPALDREHQEIIERDLVAVVEWQFGKVETNSGTSFQSCRTGNVFYLTIDEFRQIFVEYQGDEPVPILINTDHSGLEDVRANVAALY